jgi:hypothetical protein
VPKHHPGAALRLPPSTIEQAFSLLDHSTDSVTHALYVFCSVYDSFFLGEVQWSIASLNR